MLFMVQQLLPENSYRGYEVYDIVSTSPTEAVTALLDRESTKKNEGRSLFHVLDTTGEEWLIGIYSEAIRRPTFITKNGKAVHRVTTVKRFWEQRID